VLAACSCCSLDQVCDSCTYQRVRCKLQTSNVKRETSVGYEFVNIREQCAWVHADEPAAATTKARSLIASAVAKVRRDEARARGVVPLEQSVLVVGNGVAGAACADALQAQGLRVFRSEAPALSVSGSVGNFTAVMPERGEELRVGAIVLASEADLEVGGLGVFAYDPDNGHAPQVWGMATASRIGALLGQGWAVVEPIIAQVDAGRCRACGTCQELCEFHAVRVGEDGRGVLVAQVDMAACQGCGTCVAHCPSGAITAGYSTDRQIEAMLGELVR
jgi:heterodisulfide reductase subunit A-like polyferredoxin